MRSASIVGFLIALTAPLVRAAALGPGLLVQDEPLQTLTSWGYTDCGASYPPNDQLSPCLAASYAHVFFPKGTPSDLVEVKSIRLSPDPPVPGQDLTVTASGYVKDTIEVCPVL
jgi:hypothetical protein